MKNILIIGAGFAGITALRELSRSHLDINVTIIDKKSTFDFLPMLPDTIGQRIRTGNICYAISGIAKKYKCRFIQDEVVQADLKNNVVKITNSIFNYDYLIISSGAENNFYGNKQAQENAFKLYNKDDALKILKELDEGVYKNYVVIGGGYTGIEIATNIKRFLNRNNKKGDVCILEKADRILGPLPDNLRRYVYKNLSLMNVKVLEKTGAKAIEKGKVILEDGRVIDDAMVFWAPGVKMPDFFNKIEAEKGRQGRLKIDDYLRVTENCFAAGDSVDVQFHGNTLRMAIMFSLSEGKCVGQNIIREIKGLPLKKYIVNKDLGYIVPMANNRSCGIVLGKETFGIVSTFFHYLMCIYRSYGLKKRFGIFTDILRN